MTKITKIKTFPSSMPFEFVSAFGNKYIYKSGHSTGWEFYLDETGDLAPSITRRTVQHLLGCSPKTRRPCPRRSGHDQG